MKQKISTPVAFAIILVALAVFGFMARKVWLAPPDIELARNAAKGGSMPNRPMGPGPSPAHKAPSKQVPATKPTDHADGVEQKKVKVPIESEKKPVEKTETPADADKDKKDAKERSGQ